MSRFWSELARGLSPYVPGEQPQIPGLIKLNTNESPFGPSPKAIEAIRAAAADTLRLYPDPQATRLREVLAADPGLAGGQRSVFVAVESVYSMDGDIAPLRELVAVVDRLVAGQGYFVVDEAHATGVLGEKGTGVVQAVGLQQRMLVRVHTFGKALASHGGT